MTVELDGTVAELVGQDPMVIKNSKTWFHMHTYGGWSRFFEGLRQGQLLGTRCTNPRCAETRLWLPPRCECPDCWHPMEWVPAPTVGEVFTHTTVEYPGELFRARPPVPLISVSIEGVCTKLMSYMKEGRPRMGLPIRAVFNTTTPTNTILDLAWIPR